MHWWHTGAGALLRSGVVLTRSHLIVIVVSLIRHGTVLHRVAVLTLRTTCILTLREVPHLLHCEFVS